MKAEIKTKEKGFEPIELNITIESMDELQSLVSALNTPNSVREQYKMDILDKIKNTATQELWIKLGEELYNKCNIVK